MENENKGTHVKEKRTRAPKQPETVANSLTKRDFGIIAKQFEAEPSEVQAGIITASSVLQLVKIGMKEGSQVVGYLVRKSFPALTNELLYSTLSGAATNAGIAHTGADLPELLTNWQAELPELSPIVWNTFWHNMAVSMSSGYGQWAKVVVYVEYVYNVLVKPVVK